MNAWRKYARARDQIYHYSVGVRKMHEAIPVQYRTPELVQIMDIAESLCKMAQEAFDKGAMLGVQFDLYEPVPLPGFEDYHEEMKKPHWSSEA